MQTRIFTNRFFQLLVLGMMLLGANMIQKSDSKILERVRAIGFDSYNRLMPRVGTSNTVIIDIDEESLKQYGQWPWPRTVVAELTTKLAAMGVKTISYDISFAERDRTSPQVIADRLDNIKGMGQVARQLKRLPDNDDVFAKAIEDAGNVITGFVGASADTGNAPELTGSGIGGNPKSYARVFPAYDNFAVSLKKLVEPAAGNGCFSMVTDTDGLVRRVPLLIGVSRDGEVRTDITPFASLALETIRVAKGASGFRIKDEGPPYHFITSVSVLNGEQTFNIPTDKNGGFLVYYAGQRPEIYVPAWHVLKDVKGTKEKIEGKIAFLGTSSIGLLDLRSTPLDNLLPGVEIHAEVVDQILNKQFLVRGDTLNIEAVATVLAGLTIIFLAPFVSPFTLAIFMIGLIFAGVAGGVYAFRHGELVDVIYPSVVIIAIFIVSSIFSNLRTELEKRMIRQAFSHYLSPVLIAELAKNPEKLRLGGEVRNLSVMFTDIRNFTTISEAMEPAELIRMMNDFLTPMTSAVLDNRGTVDKYMGDAMMAFWNAPLDDEKHAENACRTALLMVKSLVPVNDNLKSRMEAAGKPFRELKAGIGINSGPASVGNMGSKQRFAYSALGDTVNLASRIEGQTKGYGISIMISDSVRKAAPQFAAIEIDLLTVKGRREPERVHALLGDEIEAQNPEFRAFVALHDEMLSAYRAQEWDKAAERADACATERPELFMLYKLYKERIIAYRENPPPADWGGVWVAKDK
jgi:adenylate cyclase